VTVSDTTREERKDEYETLLGVVEHNTGGKQPALARIPSVKQTALQAGVTAPRSRLQAAVEKAISCASATAWSELRRRT